jgi:deferrochelatase/peroxidase EfeB
MEKTRRGLRYVEGELLKRPGPDVGRCAIETQEEEEKRFNWGNQRKLGKSG